MRVLYQLTSPMHRTLGVQEIARRHAFLAAHAAAGTALSVEPTEDGPAAIEGAADAALVVPELLRLLPLAEQRGFDAVILGCFSDPGLDALRERSSVALVGPGASAMHFAAQLGSRFSILAPAGRGEGQVRARLRALGLESLFASVHSVGCSGTRPRPGGERRGGAHRRGGAPLRRGGRRRGHRAGLHEHGLPAGRAGGAAGSARVPGGQSRGRRAEDGRGVRRHGAPPPARGADIGHGSLNPSGSL